ncbi:uncharacterized protein [Bemisia tabaci]
MRTRSQGKKALSSVSKDVPVHAKEASASVTDAASMSKVEVKKEDTFIQPSSHSSQSSVKPKTLKNLNSVSKDVPVHAKEASTSVTDAASKSKVEVKKGDTFIQPSSHSSQSSVKPKKLKNLNRCVFFLSSTLRYEILLELFKLIHKNICPPLSTALLPLGKFSKSALCMEFSGT